MSISLISLIARSNRDGETDLLVCRVMGKLENIIVPKDFATNGLTILQAEWSDEDGLTAIFSANGDECKLVPGYIVDNS